MKSGSRHDDWQSVVWTDEAETGTNVEVVGAGTLRDERKSCDETRAEVQNRVCR